MVNGKSTEVQACGPELDANCPVDGTKLTYFTHPELGATFYKCRGFCEFIYGSRPEGLRDKLYCPLTASELEQRAAEIINRNRGNNPTSALRGKIDYLTLKGYDPNKGRESWQVKEAERKLEQIIAMARERGVNLCIRHRGTRIYNVQEEDPLRYEKLIEETHPLFKLAREMAETRHLVSREGLLLPEEFKTHYFFDSGVEWPLYFRYFGLFDDIAAKASAAKEIFGDCFVKLPSPEEIVAQAEYHSLSVKEEGKNPLKVPQEKFPLRVKITVPYTIVPCQPIKV